MTETYKSFCKFDPIIAKNWSGIWLIIKKEVKNDRI